jgi:hypothetical protein
LTSRPDTQRWARGTCRILRIAARLMWVEAERVSARQEPPVVALASRNEHAGIASQPLPTSTSFAAHFVTRRLGRCRFSAQNGSQPLPDRRALLFPCNLPQLPGMSPVSCCDGFMSRLLEALLEPSRLSKEVVQTYHQAMLMRNGCPHSSFATFPGTKQWRLYVPHLGESQSAHKVELLCGRMMRHAAERGSVMMTRDWTPPTAVLHSFEAINVHNV